MYFILDAGYGIVISFNKTSATLCLSFRQYPEPAQEALKQNGKGGLVNKLY